jgi:hypothetical protein
MESIARNVAQKVGQRCGGLRSWGLQRPSWSNESYAKRILSSLQGLEVGVGDMSPDAVNITVGVQTASSRLRSVMTLCVLSSILGSTFWTS